jgi:polyhydroxyalkanoate synthesis regulator phasin
VNALADYSDARNAVFEDMLNQLPVATRSDMDDMARELYEVKKRLRKLEKAKK